MDAMGYFFGILPFDGRNPGNNHLECINLVNHGIKLPTSTG